MPREFSIVPSAYPSLLEAIKHYILNKKIPADCICGYDPESEIIFDKTECSKYISASTMICAFTFVPTQYAENTFNM